MRTAALLVLAVLTGCGGSQQSAYAIKATVSGLAGSGLVLQLNGGHDTLVAADGERTLAYMVNGYQYNVAVKTQPTSPAQTCTVANATGTVGSTDVTNVTVTCVTTYAISGNISGLSGTGLVLNNLLGDSGSGEDLAVTVNETFIFPTRASANTKYTVTVKTQPNDPVVQTCSVGNATGTIGSTDVTDVKVICANNAFQVGGAVTGLVSGTKVVLQNNGTDDLEVAGSGSSPVSFTFSKGVADGATYKVTVKSQPTNPWQTCTVTSGTGAIASAAVSSVSVSCTVNLYAIGGSVSGLSGSGMALITNGEELPVNASSTVFLFKNRLPSLTAYDVKVKTQPSNPVQSCIVKNNSGIVGGGDVTNVVVNCTVVECQIDTDCHERDGNSCTIPKCSGGVCTEVNGNEGMDCTDNLCIIGGHCTSGACAGTQKECAAPSICHGAGTCNTGTGNCDYPITAGATCDDGNSCTDSDYCNAAGQCVGVPNNGWRGRLSISAALAASAGSWIPVQSKTYVVDGAFTKIRISGSSNQGGYLYAWWNSGHVAIYGADPASGTYNVNGTSYVYGECPTNPPSFSDNGVAMICQCGYSGGCSGTLTRGSPEASVSLPLGTVIHFEGSSVTRYGGTAANSGVWGSLEVLCP